MDLQTLTLSSDGTHYSATGLLQPVQVSDSRSSDPGWTASIQASELIPCQDFTTSSIFFDQSGATAGTPGCSNPTPVADALATHTVRMISAANVGISPVLVPPATGSLPVGAEPGPPVTPALTLPKTLAGTTLGLATNQVLAVGKGAAGGGSTGDTLIGGAVTVNIPMVTAPGSYGGLLTVTVI